MTIDSSQNVGIGTSSPAGRLDVRGGSGATGVISYFSPNAGYAAPAAANAAFSGGTRQVLWNDTATPQKLSVGMDNNATMWFANLGAQGGGASTAGGFNWYTSQSAGGTPNVAMRIDSSGNLLVGTTSGTARLVVSQSIADHNVRMLNTASSGAVYGPLVSFTGQAPNNTASIFFVCADSSATRAEIRSNGGLANFSGNNVNLSDRREKTNFAPAGKYLSKICAIPVQTFNYIDQSEDDPGLTLGVVAQDVQEVAPELVMESNWGTEEEPKQRLSIYQTDLQYALMKCIQEQQQMIETLQAKVAALEAK
jgi:hypothetical protein